MPWLWRAVFRSHSRASTPSPLDLLLVELNLSVTFRMTPVAKDLEPKELLNVIKLALPKNGIHTRNGSSAHEFDISAAAFSITHNYFLRSKNNHSVISSQENVFQFYKWGRNVIILRIIEWVSMLPVKLELHLKHVLLWVNGQQSQNPSHHLLSMISESAQCNFSE